jgi:hypothetical protein
MKNSTKQNTGPSGNSAGSELEIVLIRLVYHHVDHL